MLDYSAAENEGDPAFLCSGFYSRAEIALRCRVFGVSLELCPEC